MFINNNQPSFCQPYILSWSSLNNNNTYINNVFTCMHNYMHTHPTLQQQHTTLFSIVTRTLPDVFVITISTRVCAMCVWLNPYPDPKSPSPRLDIFLLCLPTSLFLCDLSSPPTNNYCARVLSATSLHLPRTFGQVCLNWCICTGYELVIYYVVMF